MASAFRKFGNSTGVIIPKPLLAQIGAKTGDEVDFVVENGRIVIEPKARHPREGWEEAARAIGANLEDEDQDWIEFVDGRVDEWTW